MLPYPAAPPASSRTSWPSWPPCPSRSSPGTQPRPPDSHRRAARRVPGVARWPTWGWRAGTGSHRPGSVRHSRWANPPGPVALRSRGVMGVAAGVAQILADGVAIGVHPLAEVATEAPVLGDQLVHHPAVLQLLLGAGSRPLPRNPAEVFSGGWSTPKPR